IALLPSAQPPFGGGGAEASVASRSAAAPKGGLPPPKTGRGRAIMVSCWGVTKHIQSKSMTTHQTNPELLNTVLQLLTEKSEEPRLNSSHLGISYAVFCLKKK